MTATGTITLGHVEIMQVSERSGRSLSDGDLSGRVDCGGSKLGLDSFSRDFWMWRRSVAASVVPYARTTYPISQQWT
jgi:hypothetical protein